MLGRIVGNPEVLQGVLQVVKRAMHVSFESVVLSGAGEKISLETATMLGKAAIQHAPAVMESASSKIAPVVESMFSQSINFLLSLSSKDVAKFAAEKVVEILQSPTIREELSEMMIMNSSMYFAQKLIGEGPKGLALTGILEHKPSKAIVMAAVEMAFGKALEAAGNQAKQVAEHLEKVIPNKANVQYTQYMIDELAKLSEEEMTTLMEEVANKNLSEHEFIERLNSLKASKLLEEIQPGAIQPGAIQPGAIQPGAIQPGVIQPVQPEVALLQEPAGIPMKNAPEGMVNRQHPILSIYGNAVEKASLADILEKAPTVDVQPENDKKDKHHKPS